MNEEYSIIGYIGKDAEVKSFESGKQLLTFTVAIDKSYKDVAGTKQEKTKWVQIEQWGNESHVFKVADFLKKGTHVKVSGEPISKSYLKNENENEIKHEIGIIMDDVLLLGKNKI